MSIKSATDEIRRARKVILTSKDPLEAEVLSTSGSYKHYIRPDSDGVLYCRTCLEDHGNENCWALLKVLERTAYLKDDPAPRQVSVAPEKIEARPWNVIHLERKRGGVA